ncbi:MAG: TRAP transporter substrate-binding protein DctP [Planctomycetes bacterium]|nr:TRAP transporter substrate-binding protein DctP [Planctomycetota bacterium]
MALALTTCALAAVTSPAAAQTLKLATLVPEGSLWDKSERELGAAIQKATGGRVKFQIYPGGVAGDEPDLLRKLRIGQLQAALFSAPGLGDIDPAFVLFQVPLLFENDAEVLFVLERMRPELEKRLESKGFVLLHWSNVGWLRIFASKPVASFDDFKRRRQFVWGSEGRLASWYQELGLQPVSLSATDVLTGLQTGLIEALPVTPLAALSLQWFRSAPHMLDHRFAPLLGALVVSKGAWNKLEPADREAVLGLARQSEETLFAEIPKREEEALAEMQKRGLVIAKEPAGDSQKWLALGREFQARFRANTVPPEIFDQAVKLLEEHRASR